MNTNIECPSCGGHDLDDCSFYYMAVQGVRTFLPQPLHYECLDCEWSGTDVNESGDYQAMLEDKADGEREDKKLREWEAEE